jgi:hypothetical protein
MISDDRRKAYDSLPSATRKARAEMGIFINFVRAANLMVDDQSAMNLSPPLPDIRCTIGGIPHLFELAEITDEDLATEVNKARRRQTDPDGGAFFEHEPILRVLRKKATRQYQTDGVPLDLILYYDKQYPFMPTEYMKDYPGEIADVMRPSGPFSRIWIYNNCDEQVISTLG